MKKNIFKIFFEEVSCLLLCTTIGICLIFSAYIFFDHSYLLNYSNDHIFQIHQFYTEYIRIINESISAKTPIFYSWNSLLGNNFFAAKAYYCTGDILLVLAVLLFKNINAISYILFETIFCIYVGTLFFNYYLKEINIKQKHIRIVYSLIFGIGGNTLIYLQYPMFLRFYILIPLALLAIEKYIKNGRTFLFVISVTLMLLQNYYLFVPFTLALPVYFLISCYLKEETAKFEFLKYLKKSLKLILAYLIGALNSMVLILPAFNFVISNNRLTYNELARLLTWPFKTWISLFYYLLMPVNTLFIEQPFMVDLNTEAPAVSNYYSLYISSIGVVGLSAFIFNKEIKKKRAYLITFLILLSANMILPINSLMHMETTPTMRFTFVLSLFLLIVSAKGLDNTDIKMLKKSIYFVCLFYVILISITLLTKTISINDYSVYFVTIAALIFGLLSVFFFNKKYVLLLLVMCELITYGTYYVSFKTFKEYNDELDEEIFNYYEDIDEDRLYRIAIDSKIIEPLGADDLNHNFPLVYDYMGLSTYDTTYEYGIEELIGNTNSKLANNIISFNNPALYKLLSVKYIAVENENELDDFNEYEFVYKLKHLYVYKIKNYNNLGHTYSKFVRDFNDADDLNKTLVVNDDLYEKTFDIKETVKKQLINIHQVSDNNFSGEITVDSKQVLLITIPYDNGWRIKDNGENIKSYSVDGGLTGLILEEGNHEIEAYYQPPGFKQGFMLSLAGGLLTLIVLIIEIKQRKKIMVKFK